MLYIRACSETLLLFQRVILGMDCTYRPLIFLTQGLLNLGATRENGSGHSHLQVHSGYPYPIEPECGLGESPASVETDSQDFKILNCSHQGAVYR